MYTSLAAAPSPKCPANPERTPEMYRDRGFPEVPRAARE